MISCSPLARQRARTIAWLSLLASVAAGCEQPLDLSALAEGQSAARNTRQSLEFDLPEQYLNKDANGEFVITGFRLGVFQAGSAEPSATRDVGREAVVVMGRTGQVVLTPQEVSEKMGPVVLRLQTLTRQGASEWSGPSAAVTETNSARPGPAPAKAVRERRGLSMTDVEQRPRLADALAKVMPEAAKRQVVLASFRNINQLAQAVAICAAQDIALDTLGQKLAGPPRRSLRNAVWELKPELRGTDAIRKANAAAKELLAASPKPKS